MGKAVRNFIASSAELKEEREQCVLLINQLNKSHRHLHLQPVEWEYDLVHGSNPGYQNIQAAINPLLHESDMALFMFYSKIGKYTKEEFDQATAAQKKLFAFFKKGFETNLDTMDLYRELLQFKKSLNDTVLYKEYRDMTEFEALLYPHLNQHLVEKYALAETAVANTQSPELRTLIQLLAEKEKEIKELKASTGRVVTVGEEDHLQQLLEEKEAIQKQLSQNEEIIKQQAKEKEALEHQLALQTQNDQLKAKALEEVEKGNYAEAETYLKESAKEKISDVASTIFELAKIKKLQIQYAEAFDYYELAAKINPENSLYLNDAGIMANDLGYANKALEYGENSLTAAINEYGEAHPNIATYYNNLGSAYDNKGEYDKAISYYEKALVLNKQFYGEEHPQIAIYYNNLGLIYNNKGEYDKAISYYEKALLLDKQFYGEEHPNIATYYNNLGSVYNSKDEYDKAISYYNLSLQILEKFLSPDHPSMQTVTENLAYARTAQKEQEAS